MGHLMRCARARMIPGSLSLPPSQAPLPSFVARRRGFASSPLKLSFPSLDDLLPTDARSLAPPLKSIIPGANEAPHARPRPLSHAATDPSAVDRDENYGWRPSAFGRLPLGDLTDLVGTRMPLKVAASRTIMLRFEYLMNKLILWRQRQGRKSCNPQRAREPA